MSHNKHALHQAFTIEFTGIARALGAIALKELDMTGPRLDPIGMEIDGKQIRFYFGSVPDNLAREIERIYQNIFSSMEKFAADGVLGTAECYVSSSASGIDTILFFIRQGGTATVLNSAIAIAPGAVDIFCKAVFRVHRTVHRIRFEAVQCDMAGITLPYQQYDCLENIVVTLPDSVPAYLKLLGRGMRAGIKKNLKKLETQVDGFRWQIYKGADISSEDIHDLVALSSARIASKNMKTSHTDVKTLRLIKMLKSSGSVLVATVNGRICGGVICTAYGGNFYMHVVAHEGAYHGFSLGKICIFLSIQHAIEHGAREYQFLWGAYRYKFDFLGQQRNYDRIVIYRSALRMALSPLSFIQVAVRGLGRRARLWLRNRQRHIGTDHP